MISKLIAERIKQLAGDGKIDEKHCSIGIFSQIIPKIKSERATIAYMKQNTKAFNVVVRFVRSDGRFTADSELMATEDIANYLTVCRMGEIAGIVDGICKGRSDVSFDYHVSPSGGSLLLAIFDAK